MDPVLRSYNWKHQHEPLAYRTETKTRIRRRHSVHTHSLPFLAVCAKKGLEAMTMVPMSIFCAQIVDFSTAFSRVSWGKWLIPGLMLGKNKVNQEHYVAPESQVLKKLWGYVPSTQKSIWGAKSGIIRTRKHIIIIQKIKIRIQESMLI